MRIDGHQHFWTLSRDDYYWLTPELGALYREFGPNDLAPLLDGASIDTSILVQAAPTVAETHYLLEIASNNDLIAGVVGWVDLDDASATDQAVAKLTLHSKFVGVRPMLQDLTDPAWIAADVLQPAVDILISNNVRFDALVTSTHLPFLLDFLTHNPDLRCVIDHGAKPGISKGEWQPWADLMSQLADQTESFCKLSGLITEASPSQSADDLAPYVDHLLETFGPKRIIWGSDWPVLNLASNYEEWHSITDQLLNALSENEIEQVRGKNAAEFYGLAVEGAN